MYSVPMEGHVLRGHKRKLGCGGEGDGLASKSSASPAMARPWVTLCGLPGANLHRAPGGRLSLSTEDEAWNADIQGLTQRLAERNIKLVNIGGSLRVCYD